VVLMKNHGASHYIVKFGYFAFVGVVVVAILYSLWLIALPLVAAILLSFVLDPVINYFETKGARRFPVIIWLTLVLIALSGAVAYFVIPRLIAEAQNVAGDIPQYKQLVQDAFQKIQVILQSKFPQATIPDLYRLLVQQIPIGKKIDINDVISHLSSFFSILSIVLLIPIITFFLLADGHIINKFVLNIVPNRYFEMCILLFHKISSALKLFLRGQMVDAGAVTVLTAVGLSVIGLPYAFLIALVAGVGNLIPYLGPVIGFIPAFFVILLSGFNMGLLVGVIVVFVLVQFIEGTFIYPFAVGKSVDMHPLVVIIGITVGGQIGGIIGMLVTIPIISVAKVSLDVLRTYLKAYTII
jgi:putative permease